MSFHFPYKVKYHASIGGMVYSTQLHIINVKMLQKVQIIINT